MSAVNPNIYAWGGRLQDDTLGLILGSFVVVMAAPATATIRGSAHAVLLVVAGARARLLPVCGAAATALVSLSPQLPDDIEKGLLHVDAILGRSFDEIATEVFRQSLALLRRHLALGDTVAFVANKHDRSLTEDGCRCAEGGARIGRRASHGRLFDALDLAVEALYAGKG